MGWGCGEGRRFLKGPRAEGSLGAGLGVVTLNMYRGVSEGQGSERHQAGGGALGVGLGASYYRLTDLWRIDWAILGSGSEAQ